VTAPADVPPLVSVAMITFNHERYVAQAVESVFAQRVDFPIEVLVGDDCSTDGTPALLQGLASKFGNRLNVIQRSTNIGMTRNYFDVLSRCRGRYIALLEGDDYWTDPEKLALQVAILERRSDVAMCHHNVDVLDEPTGRREPFHARPPAAVVSGRVLLRDNVAATCSVMYRRQFDAFPEWVHRCRMGDWPSHLLHALGSRIAYLDRTMGVYRRHAGGVWSQQTQRVDLQRRMESARVMAEALPPADSHGMHRTVARFANDLAELSVQEGNFDEASQFIHEQRIPTAGLERLTHFYQGLAKEQAGRRLPAILDLLKAAAVGRGVTRIQGQDLAIALFRTSFPRLYRLARKSFGR